MILREAVTFHAPAPVADGYGGQRQGWTEKFSTRAHFRYLRGGESVQAARLEGRQPVVATVRAQAASAEIAADWRMTDDRTGTVYAVRAVVPTEDRGSFEVTAESGVAP